MPDVSGIQPSSFGEAAPLKPLGGSKGALETPSGTAATIVPLADLADTPPRVRSGSSKAENQVPEHFPTDAPTPSGEVTKPMPRHVEKEPKGDAKNISERVKLATEEFAAMGTAIKGIHSRLDRANTLLKKFKNDAEDAIKQSLQDNVPLAERQRLSGVAKRRFSDAEKQEKIVQQLEVEAKAQHAEMVNKAKEIKESKFIANVANLIDQANITELSKLLKENKGAIEKNRQGLEQHLSADQLKKFDAIKQWIDMPREDAKEIHVMHDMINLIVLKKELTLDRKTGEKTRAYDFDDIEARYQATDKNAYLVGNPIIKGHEVLKSFADPSELARIDAQRIYRIVQMKAQKGQFTSGLQNELEKTGIPKETIVKYLQEAEIKAGILGAVGETRYNALLQSMM